MLHFMLRISVICVAIATTFVLGILVARALGYETSIRASMILKNNSLECGTACWHDINLQVATVGSVEQALLADDSLISDLTDSDFGLCW